MTTPQALPGRAEAAEQRPAWHPLGAVPLILAVALPLGLVVLVVRRFELEDRVLYRTLLLALAGFPIHALLPRRLRLPCFSLLSLAAVAWAFGAGNAAWVAALGSVMIGLCHVPVPFRGRVALVLAAGAGLALLRADLIDAPVPDVVWPILGSMFMFRLALYLYSIRHRDAPFGVWQSLAYFFMLPSAAFGLFPIVDYKTFIRTYYDAADPEIYERGIRWLVRGVTHLLAWRLVYHHLMLAPYQVATLGDLVQYVTASYLLYLRVSGQFHLIVGLLHLFGFHLPETHHLYFLASSFSDYWRRINIYWKDFMMKLVYYPWFFRLRARGTGFAMVTGTLIVFASTWALHSYQWFWLRGTTLLTPPDVLFWAAFGVLVVISMHLEVGKTRSRPGRGEAWDLRLACKRVGVFLTISALWSLWSSDSVAGWVGLFEAVSRTTGREVAIIGVIAGLALAVAGRRWGEARLGAGAVKPRAVPALLHASGVAVSILGGLLLLQPLEPRFAPPVRKLVRTLGEHRLSRQEEALLERGYYEQLNRRSGSFALWAPRPDLLALPGLDQAGGYRRRTDFLRVELVPNLSVTAWGEPFRTNRWGMRDRDYELAKPAGTFRIAVLGPSFAMGLGVGDDQPFESVLEAQLNRDHGGGRYARYEILNFSVSNYSILHQAVLLDERVLNFQPDRVLVVVDPDFRFKLLLAVVNAVRMGGPLPFAELDSLVRAAGVEAGTDRTTALRRLGLRGNAILEVAFAHLARSLRARDIVPVLVIIRLPDTRRTSDPAAVALAARYGFEVIDLSDAYRGFDEESLALSTEDHHPNPAGHRLLAQLLYRELRAREATLRLGLDGSLPANGPRPQ